MVPSSAGTALKQMTSFPAVGGYFGAVRVQRLKLWVLWSSQPCVRPQGAVACLLYWGSSTQRAVICSAPVHGKQFILVALKVRSPSGSAVGETGYEVVE